MPILTLRKHHNIYEHYNAPVDHQAPSTSSGKLINQGKEQGATNSSKSMHLDDSIPRTAAIPTVQNMNASSPMVNEAERENVASRNLVSVNETFPPRLEFQTAKGTKSASDDVQGVLNVTTGTSVTMNSEEQVHESSSNAVAFANDTRTESNITHSSEHKSNVLADGTRMIAGLASVQIEGTKQGDAFANETLTNEKESNITHTSQQESNVQADVNGMTTGIAYAQTNDTEQRGAFVSNAEKIDGAAEERSGNTTEYVPTGTTETVNVTSITSAGINMTEANSTFVSDPNVPNEPETANVTSIISAGMNMKEANPTFVSDSNVSKEPVRADDIGIMGDTTGNENSTSEDSATKDLNNVGNILKPLIQKMSEYLRLSTTQSSEYDMVTIGNAQFMRSAVTAVGDIDSNGVDDYIVANPAADNYTGNIRLYLMTTEKKFLYTRDLVPGKWGFDAPPLKQGDRFGTAVYRLPSSNMVSQCFIAISAPGDKALEKDHGALYVIQLSNRGNVMKSSKHSMNSFRTMASEYVEERMGSEAKVMNSGDFAGGLNGERSGLELLKGVSHVLFLNASGDVMHGMDIETERDMSLLGPIEDYLRRKEEEDKENSEPALNVTIRADETGGVGGCIFNDTHCACQLTEDDNEYGQCLEEVGLQASSGRKLCLARSCHSTFWCTCDGQDMCERVEVSRNVFVSDGRAEGGLEYCTQVSGTVLTNVLRVNMLETEVPKRENMVHGSEYCRCSFQYQAADQKTCLGVLRIENSVGMVCEKKRCDEEKRYVCDENGVVQCRKQYIKRVKYVSDDIDEGEDGTVHCHEMVQEEVDVTVV